MEEMTVMSGAEAIVRGAMESGVKIISGYPGYPITGILENAKKVGTQDQHIEWAPNEKVALETVLGASVVGYRGMAVMKQVGANVAADPLMSAVTWGVRGGVVIVMGDDPGSDGSPVEQDSRCYGTLANIPVLEPSTPEEGRQMVRAAFSVSERFGLPIILRFTKEYVALKGDVERGDISPAYKLASKENLATFRGVWTDPVEQHFLRHEKMASIIAEFSRFNTREMNGNIGIITSGYVTNVVYSGLKQLSADGKVSILKLGVIPCKDETLESFLNGIDQVLVIEVGEPVIEQQVRTIFKKPFFGKMSGHISYVGAINVDDLTKVMEQFLKGMQFEEWRPPTPRFHKIIGRPFFGDLKGDPVMCPGCPGIGLQYALKRAKEKYDFVVFGDNGCVDLAALKPYGTLDYALCMGGSPGAAHGASVAGGKGVALIGDSAFIHSGIGGLLNMIYNNSKATIIVFDNLSTAMTGRQPNPATGVTIQGRKAKRIMIEDLCKSCGVEQVAVVDPYDLERCQKAIEKAVTSEDTSVLIARRECALLPGINYGRAVINTNKCNGCLDCIDKMKCPALSFKEMIKIDEKCNGCMICAQVCPEGAITKVKGRPA